MLTAPLTGARYPEPTDGPLGALQIGYAVADLEDNTIPRFATTGERDTAYAAWVAAGGTMAAGLYCTVAGRLMRHTGTAWQYVPTYRGAGTTLPSDGVNGDTYYHQTYRCTMRNRYGSGWVQADLARVDSEADRATFLADLAAAGLLMHGGFLVRQNDNDTLWWAVTNTTLGILAGLPDYGGRNSAQIQRIGMAVAANNDPDVWTLVNNWAVIRSAPIISVQANGTITCDEDGWVAVNGYAYSDDTVAGRSGVALDIPATAFPVSRINDVRARAANTGYSGAGVLRQTFSWSGRVKGGDVFRLYLNQDSTDNGSIDYNAYLSVEYML